MEKKFPHGELLRIIKCPICASSVEISGGSLICGGARRHCFDFSSSGYVNLLTSGKSESGDSKSAVGARRRFLELDYYLPAAMALADAVEKYSPMGSVVIDAGCGEGYYTAKIAERGYAVGAVDISKYASDAAAKRLGAGNADNFFTCVGSVFELPFADGSADAIVNVFAPCAEAEFTRVLRSGGHLLVMYAGREHLLGLKNAIYDRVRENDERRDLPKKMKLIETIPVRFDITVDGTDRLLDLFAMTPYYWKTSVSDGDKLKKLDSLTTVVDMVIAVYRKE